MRVSFLKMHGAGNRIVVVDERIDDRPPPQADRIKALGDSRTGPGFDQLMWVGPAGDASFAASYRVFNADGSEVEQCGNGVRCVAWMLARDDDATREFRLQGPAGPVDAHLLDDGRVSVAMGAPEFLPERVPFEAERRAKTYTLDVDGTRIVVSVLSMGNPHCVLEVDDVVDADVGRLGPLIERHRRFPAGTNVEFMAIRDRRNIDLRVHERGVGETPACGTGACAAAVAGRCLGMLDETVTVHLPGGQLVVSWHGAGQTVWLTGPAELTSEGTIDL